MSRSIEELLRSHQSFDLRSAFDDAIARSYHPADDGDKSGDTGSGSGDTGDLSGSSGSGDSGSSGTSTDSGSTGDDIKDPEKKKLHEEAAQWRVKHKEAETELVKLQQQLRAFEDKDKGELEKATRDRDEYKAALDKANAVIREQAINLAVLEDPLSKQFKNISTARRLLNLDDVKVEDGKADADSIHKKIEALQKAEPYLTHDSGDSGSGAGNQSSGRPANGGKSDSGNRAALEQKFPALRGRGV
jgi:hypothetical protein